MLARLLAARLKGASKSVLLLGPRQTGKSTLLMGLEPDLVIDLADESEFLTFAANPGELSQRLSARKYTTVLIDEVQRLPSLLNTVQSLLDGAKRSGRTLKFYLSGSSARKLRRGQANLLPGRVLTYRLGPLACAEIGAGFDPRRAMELGTLPEPYLEPDRAMAEKLLSSYAGTYLKEEIQAEALSRNLEGFSRFLHVAAATSGQSLDFSKLAQRSRVSRTSTLRYFEALEDTLLVHRLEPYPDAKDADLVKHPRFFFFDTGVLNGILGGFAASADRVGNLFEHLVVSQLVATAVALDREMALHSFRTRGGLEVDFIVRLGEVLWALEAKSTAHPSERDAATLVAAQSYLPKNTKRVIVVPNSPPRKLESGVEVLGLADLLAAMAT